MSNIPPQAKFFVFDKDYKNFLAWDNTMCLFVLIKYI